MGRTIFGKLLTTFFIVLIITALLSGTMLSFFLANFITKDKKVTLQEGTENILGFLDLYLDSNSSEMGFGFLLYGIQTTGINTSSIVYIIDNNGEIKIIYPKIAELRVEISNKFTTENQITKLPNENMYKDVIKNDKTINDVGTFNGLYSDTGILWLTYGKAIKDTNGNIIGAVIMSTSLPEALKLRSDVFRLFLIAMMISMLISFVIIYVVSLKITRPLKTIRDAARIISNGKFDKRIKYIPDDEIGELAISFNQMSGALENLDKMRSDFFANVSHDLRTPMTSIGGFIEGILDGTIPSERHEYYLKIVRQEIKRLNNLINNILDMAKIDAGELAINLSVFNINEVIRRSIIKFENMFVENDIDIEAEFDSEETYVEADIDAVERILINLIHNAIKFIGDNEKKITISTSVQKEKVLIKIQDTGEGIDEYELSFIWERFHKADKSRGQDRVGTGLGLSIVKTLINEHGQDIWVESKKNEGTTFTFTLKFVE